jgi:hypothetical protein
MPIVCAEEREAHGLREAGYLVVVHEDGLPIPTIHRSAKEDRFGRSTEHPQSWQMFSTI